MLKSKENSHKYRMCVFCKFRLVFENAMKTWTYRISILSWQQCANALLDGYKIRNEFLFLPRRSQRYQLTTSLESGTYFTICVTHFTIWRRLPRRSYLPLGRVELDKALRLSGLSQLAHKGSSGDLKYSSKRLRLGVFWK